MEIEYKEEKEFTKQQLKSLFSSVHWESANYADRLAHYEDYLYIKIMPSDPAVKPFYEKYGFVEYDNYSAMEIKRL